MVWRRRPRREHEVPQPGAAGREPVSQVEAHRSPGLRTALEGLDPTRSFTVVDLGPAMSSTVSFFSEYRCRLVVVDLLASLPSPPDGEVSADDSGEGPTGKAWREAVTRLLPGDEPEYDLVLAWDVFDHLDQEQADQLVDQLAALCRPGARLFATVATSRERPARPRCFGILGAEVLEYRPTDLPATSRPVLNPSALEKLLAGFETLHSVVLRNGQRECVVARRSFPGE